MALELLKRAVNLVAAHMAVAVADQVAPLRNLLLPVAIRAVAVAVVICMDLMVKGLLVVLVKLIFPGQLNNYE